MEGRPKILMGITTKNAHINLVSTPLQVWCGINDGPTPTELEYQPTKLQNFQELDRQFGYEMEIPP
jgi:hypothetical protein